MNISNKALRYTSVCLLLLGSLPQLSHAGAVERTTANRIKLEMKNDHGFDHGVDHAAAHSQKRLRQAPMPTQPSLLPPTAEQRKFNLPPSKRDPRLNANKQTKQNGKTVLASPPPAECLDMNKMASYSGTALADYLVSLPDFECTYPLFSLNSSQAAGIYSNANYTAIANRFNQEAANYNASNMALVNLTLYLRAGYYLAESINAAQAPATLKASLRPAITQLINGNQLFLNNPVATSSAKEVMLLITNMYDEANYLPSIKNLVARFTNSSATPNASDALLNSTASNGYTGALIVFYYAHGRLEASNLLQDLSYASTLNNFVVNNKAKLLATWAAYQLRETENEAFRFMQYASLKPNIKPMVQTQLATSSMTGSDGDLWLGAATAVNYYDYANCADYGTCNFETTLANTILKNNHTCSPTIKIRAQEMTTEQLQASCDLLSAEESYFHAMLPNNLTPVANDNNKALELVVFDDYTNYNKYAGIIYGIGTNNGGMYLEGNPADINNQARFIAHEASWLRPSFSVWNLEHEYVHYLDGRFNMVGDFGAAISKPTVWWLEGVAEYLSRKNDNQAAIDTAKTGSYKLSTIFGNTYSMSDYANRAYPWGYMAVRFMNEQHRADVNAVLSKFRTGDYDGYQTYMNNLGTRYDSEFASWAQSATTAGTPPMPTDAVSTLPNCTTNYSYYLGNHCSLKNLSSNTQSYVYIMVPAGTKSLKIMTGGGTGNVDLYVKKDNYPSTTVYDAASFTTGNDDSITISNPTPNAWYYILLKANSSFSNVSVGASYE